MTHPNSVRTGLVLDQAALLDSVGGDAEFLVETVGLFLAACPTLLSQMREALGVNDFTEAARAARILKSSLRNFAVGHALNAADALEAAACQRQPSAVTEAFRALEEELEGLTSALSELEGLRGHVHPGAARAGIHAKMRIMKGRIPA